MIYKFNDITIDTKNYQLLQNTKALTVEPQVFNLIVYLIEHRDRVVLRQELLDALWAGKVVSDATISNHIKSARKVLGDDGNKQKVIKTIHGRGYQFIAQLENNEILKNSHNNSKVFLINRKLILLVLSIFMIVLVLWFYPLRYWSEESDENNKDNKSIAVLAFKDLSPESNQEYFSDGLSEELLNLFTQIPDLSVASRTSSFSFKNKKVTLEQIGQELNVNYIMEGSVRKSGEKLRVTVQLIRVSDGSHIWSQTYDHDMQNVFKIQDEIALAVSEKLEISLSNDRIVKKKPVNPGAHSLYLKGLYYFRENTDTSIKQALEIIAESLAIDANYVPALTLKSRIYYRLAIYSYGEDDREKLELAKNAVIKARAIDHSYATANAQMALINLIEYDFAAARFNIDLAMSSKEKRTATVDIIAYYFLLTGQVERSVEMLYEDLDINPINDTHFLQLAIGYLFFNQFNDVKNIIKKYNFYHSSSQGSNWVYYYYLIATKNHQKAADEVLQQSNKFWNLTLLEFLNYSQGNKEEADKYLALIIEKYAHAPMHIAIHYALRNDNGSVFLWLEKAYKKRDLELLFLINHPAFRVIWSDSRWSQLVSKMKLPKEHWLLDKELIEATSASTNDS
ncbi:MAG: winged helix-turn-helix domain-containing protein [Proteobacteria bacterium]|nr:winged helix-turn-helix domain-containing protein [Pseudomonadota bacterium]